MGGIYPAHIRRLCDNPWDGGGGFLPADVGAMTLDQVAFLLCDKKLLRAGDDRIVAMPAIDVLGKTTTGVVKGRTSDGVEFTAGITGKSMAQLLMERDAAKKHTTKVKQRRRGKSYGNGTSQSVGHNTG